MKRVLSIILAVLILFSVFPLMANAGTEYLTNTTVGRDGNKAIRWNYGTYTGYAFYYNEGNCYLPDGEGTLYYTNDIPGYVYAVGNEGLPTDGPQQDADYKAIKYVGGFSDGYCYGKGVRYYEGGYRMDGTFYGSYKNAYDNTSDKIIWDGLFYLNNNKFLVGYETATSHTTGEFHWQTCYYFVKYNANGGSGAPDSDLKEHDVALTISSTIPTRDGYDFLGWSTDKNATTASYSAGGTYTKNSEATLYAVWKIKTYSINFNANGGTGAPAGKTKTYGKDLVLPSVIPEREDYRFLGWATSSSSKTPTYQAGDIYSENKDITLYAVWEKTRFSITYDANGGTGAPELQKKNKGEDLALSAAVPQREGYTFLGWAEKNAFINGDSVNAVFTSIDAIGYYDVLTGTFYPISGQSYPNMNLNSYPVDSSMQSSMINPAYKSSIRNTAAQVAYQPGDIYTADKDVDLYAVWSGDYTITYDANGGEGAPSPQTYSGNGALAISSQIPRKSGYIFKGWAESADATEATYQPGDAYINQESVTLFAVWEAKAGPYTITYEANGGVGAPAPQYKNVGETITLSNVIPTRLGYRFVRWSTYVQVQLLVTLSLNNTQFFTQYYYADYSPGSSYSYDCDVTLYAVWQKEDWTANYSVETYMMDTQGEYVKTSVDEYVADFEVVSADFIVPPGFTLNTENSILTKQVVYKTDTVLKVYVDRNIHTVSFDDGTQTVSNDLYYGANIVAPQNPEKEGYTFLGWSEDGETVVDIEQTVPDSDLSYMAVWSRNQYTITYKLDSEEYVGQSYLSAEDTILFGDTVTVREKPEITCRIVTDWEFTPALIDGKMPAQNVVANAYTTFDHTPSDAVVENRIEPTCIEEGSYDTVVYCSVCGEEISRETTSLPIIAHDYEEVVIAPTCTEEGYSIFTCSYCGLAYEDLTVEALGHDWGEWTNTVAPTCISVGEEMRVCKRDSSHTETREAPIDPDNHTNVDGEWTVVVPATCTDDGTKVKYCQDCHEIAQTETIAIDLNNHDYQFTETVSPTCTQQGYDVYTCSRCNVSENRNYTEALGHNYEPVVTAPTCTQEGYTTYTCSKCGDTYTDEAVDALGHDWGEWTNTVAATCISVGEDIRVCQRDSSHTETREVPIDPNNHTNVDIKWTVVVPATCTSEGTLIKYCQDCHEIAKSEQIEADPNNHDYQYIETVSPTCTQQGYDVYTCSRCNNTENKRYTDALGHNYEPVVTAPTCTQEGYTTYTCSRCGDTYTDEAVDTLGHDWGEWTNTIAPTCISVGEDTRVCKRDSSHTETREVPINPDNHTNVDGEWTVVTPATCTDDGTKVKYCQDCHEIAQTETIAIDPNNHDYQFTETVSPTCTQQGYDVYTCSRCNVTQNRNYTEPLGHDWGEWTNTVAPTCISVGEDTRVCKRDSSHTETREAPINPENHTNVDGVWTVVTPATCTSDGTKVKYCQDCHEIAQTETIALNSDNHNYQFTETVSPTCTQQGYDIYTCSRCNVTENRNHTDALGHNYEPVVTAPTCTQAGYTTYTCSRCGDNYTDTPVAALGHDWGEWVTVTEATFDDDGLEERVCKRDPSHKETRVIPKPTSFTATFVVNNDDGSLTTVDTVRFVRGQVAIKEPDVPSKGDNYIGYWEPYSLSGGDIVIHAKYDLKTSDTEKPLETGKDVIYENGTVKVTMSAFAESVNAKVNFGAQPVDVLLVLDHSYSMISNKMNNNSMTRYDALKQSARAFVEGICDSAQDNNVDHRISVISFNSSVFYLTGNNANNTYYSALNNRQSLINAVSGSRKSGSGTRTDLGISEAKNILNTSADLNRKQIVVVFTDGEPTSGQSSFDITVANNALAAARDIKNDIGASIYCVGVTENADPEATVVTNSSNRKDQLNALLHAVSSNYENGNTVSMTNIGSRVSDGYYVATEDADELTRLFKNIVAQQISNTITFRNLTLVDTISEYFTLTVEQENVLRDYLEENYAVSSENVIITRNDDGTTTIRIEDVTPRAVYSNEVQTGYGVTVTYEVSANENAIEAGFYSVSTDENSYIEKDEQKVAEFNLPDDIEIEQARYIVKYILDGEVYCVEETQAGAVISPPQLENAVFVVGNNSVVTDRVTEISGSIVSFEPVFVEDSGKFIDFDLNNMLIKNIPQGTKDLDSLLNLDGYTVETDNGIIATGSLVTLKNAAGVEVASFTAVVGGDVTGDGYIDAFDLALVGEYINSFTEPEGEAYMKAVDMVEDGYLDATDMAYLIYTANFEI